MSKKEYIIYKCGICKKVIEGKIIHKEGKILCRECWSDLCVTGQCDLCNNRIHIDEPAHKDDLLKKTLCDKCYSIRFCTDDYTPIVRYLLECIEVLKEKITEKEN